MFQDLVYAEAALKHHRTIVSVLSPEDGVIPFARAAAYRLARTHIFEAL